MYHRQEDMICIMIYSPVRRDIKLVLYHRSSWVFDMTPDHIHSKASASRLYANNHYLVCIHKAVKLNHQKMPTCLPPDLQMGLMRDPTLNSEMKGLFPSVDLLILHSFNVKADN